MRRLAPIAALLGCALAAQEPSPGKEPAPKGEEPKVQDPPPPSREQRERAAALLEAYGARCKDLKALVADYVQRRTTTLSRRPLVSEGRFVFVGEPACIVFRGAVPRPSVVRLTPKVYEVLRPRRKRLERFHLDGPALAKGLFAAVGGDVAALRREFDLLAVEDVAGEPAGRVRLRFAPKAEAVRARLRELALTMRARDAQLLAVSYRDRGGDLVEIELREAVANPEQPPSTELDVPDGTRVVEHREGH